MSITTESTVLKDTASLQGLLEAAFEEVHAYNKYNLYNWLYNAYNNVNIVCVCVWAVPARLGQNRTGSDRGLLWTCHWEQQGWQVSSTGKSSCSSRVTSALCAFVVFRKDAVGYQSLARIQISLTRRVELPGPGPLLVPVAHDRQHSVHS